MKFDYFEIKNFRGIENVRLDFAKAPRAKVHTLVGLNESGKTTILEALNYFTYKPESLGALDLRGYAIDDIHSLIPIAKRSNFNDTIEITVGLALDEQDELAVKERIKRELGFNALKPVGTVKITQQFVFKDSKHQDEPSKNLWSFNVWVRKPGKGQRERWLPLGHDWQQVLKMLKALMPSILYFPNFLFEFPDKIYLDDPPTDKDKHAFYRLVLQDILDALNNNLSLSTHLVSRAKNPDKNEARNLQNLLLEMGRHVTTTIFKAWNEIFHQKVGDKKISLTCETDENGLLYVQFRIEDTDGIYLINERSLGFRWFFVFLLLTQYRGFRTGGNGEILFLLDEPASNLHPAAQSQLLNSFKELSARCSIVYTTHSHHLINPEWLESTYVVRNENLDYGSEPDNYNARKTRIALYRYRDFVAKHPNQTTYFKPILDVLDYAPSKLENIPDIVMVEGKNDFYTISLIATASTSSQSHRLNFLPGGGAGSLDTVIRLYIAWGRSFVILLDSDKEGKNQKERYLKLFDTLLLDRVFCLSDIDSTWDKAEMEDLLGDDYLAIQQTAYPTEIKKSKTHLNRAIQELLTTKTSPNVSPTTIANFVKIISFLRGKLRNPDGDKVEILDI